jgi:UDP-galactopyranose mutase
MNNRRKALIVGSGLAGSSCARVLADSGWSVDIHESEYYVGGHVRTSEYQGVLYEQNAIHVNHTDSDEVIQFIKRFADWIPYIHYVKTEIPPGVFSWPPQISELKGLEEWPLIEKELSDLPEKPDEANFETYAISIMGKTLYEWFIRPYTEKQWGTDPKNLSSSFAPKRIDLRQDDYLPLFRDKWQGWPNGGWTKLVESILRHRDISVKFGVTHTEKTVDWEMYDAVIVTCALDDFLNVEQLPWKGVRVEHEYIPDQEGMYLEAGQVNHPGLDKEYTRRTETKFMSGQKDIKGTIITYEYPGANAKHYPVDDVDGKNRQRANELKKTLTSLHGNAIICGRLANYVYINTDQAILQGINAAKKAKSLVENKNNE